MAEDKNITRPEEQKDHQQLIEKNIEKKLLDIQLQQLLEKQQQHRNLLLFGIISIAGAFVLFACLKSDIFRFGNGKTLVMFLEQQLNNTIKERDILQQNLTACKDSLSYPNLVPTVNDQCNREKNNSKTTLIDAHQSEVKGLKKERDEKEIQIREQQEKIIKLNNFIATVQKKVTEIAPMDEGEEGKECEGVVNCGLKFVASTIDQAADILKT